MVSKLNKLGGLFMLILGISSFAKNSKKPPPFTAKFYDETGIFLGSFGEVNDDSPIYIASCETLFPYKFMSGDLVMTPKDIILKVGTEIIYDRFPPIVELNTHVGICKLPPKKHRDEIHEIIESTHLDTHNLLKLDSIDFEIGGVQINFGLKKRLNYDSKSSLQRRFKNRNDAS